jgi:hypothetical protein
MMEELFHHRFLYPVDFIRLCADFDVQAARTRYGEAPDRQSITSLETVPMALGKQAKTLTKAQVDAALGYLGTTRTVARYPYASR